MFDLEYYKSINNDTNIKKIFNNVASCDGIRKTDQLSILSGFLKNRHPVIIQEEHGLGKFYKKIDTNPDIIINILYENKK